MSQSCVTWRNRIENYDNNSLKVKANTGGSYIHTFCIYFKDRLYPFLVQRGRQLKQRRESGSERTWWLHLWSSGFKRVFSQRGGCKVGLHHWLSLTRKEYKLSPPRVLSPRLLKPHWRKRSEERHLWLFPPMGFEKARMRREDVKTLQLRLWNMLTNRPLEQVLARWYIVFVRFDFLY